MTAVMGRWLSLMLALGCASSADIRSENRDHGELVLTSLDAAFDGWFNDEADRIQSLPDADRISQGLDLKTTHDQWVALVDLTEITLRAYERGDGELEDFIAAVDRMRRFLRARGITWKEP